MPKQKPLPSVRLEAVFVRDAQRRLRLVIELLEQEALLQRTPSASSQTEPQRAQAASLSHPGGNV